MSKEEAIVYMVDSNLHRTNILPSEKSKAYKMKYEALKSQKKRTDLTLRPVGAKLRTEDLVGEDIGDSGIQVQRYLMLNELISELLDMVDNSVLNEKTSNVEYADNKVEMMVDKSKNAITRSTKKVFTKTKDRMIKNYKRRRTNKIKIKVEKEIEKQALEQVKDVPKNIEKTRKATIRSKQVAQKSAKVAVSITKKITKSIITPTKALISGVKSLIALLGTRGIIAVVVVILVCLIGLLCLSIFDIFFSNESNSRTMSSVISQINNEIYQKAEKEQLMTPNSEIVMDNTVTNWKEVIAVYSVKYANDKENADIIMYINEKNIKNIRAVFNDFNYFNKVSISKSSSNGYLITKDGSFIQSPNTQSEAEDGKTLIHVIIQSKSLDDVMNQYSFTDEQKKNTKELLSDRYSDLWT